MEERHSDLRDLINLRMGGFHATCVFLGVIGKQFGDAGLKDVMVEAGIVGEDAAQKVLRGRHYNSGMRAHLYIAEAMTRLKLDAFLDGSFFMTNIMCMTLYSNRMKLNRLRSSETVTT